MSCAPTKIILLGEHSIVYGGSAISFPVPLKTTIHVQTAAHLSIESNYPFSDINKKKVMQQVQAILQELGEQDANIKMHIHLEAPPGSGFGVSASVAVALIQALYELYHTKLSEEKLFQLAEKLESIHHGNPSGIDHTTIIANEPIIFRKSKFEKKPEFANAAILQNFYLIQTGTPQESTKEMVELVAQKYAKNPHETKILFHKLNVMVPIVASALIRGDEEVFRDILNEAGTVLESLGVVSHSVEEISAEIRQNGGMAKISGAGGRTQGSGILLVWHREESFIDMLCKKYDLSYWSFYSLKQ